MTHHRLPCRPGAQTTGSTLRAWLFALLLAGLGNAPAADTVTGDQALQRLDQVIQQNAAASEEMASTAEELCSQAEQLQSTIAFFRTGENRQPKTAAPRPHPAVSKIPARTPSAPAAKPAAKVGANHAGPRPSGVKIELGAAGHDPHDQEFERF